MTEHATLADLETKAREFHRLWCEREGCFGPIIRDYEMAELSLAQQARMSSGLPDSLGPSEAYEEMQ